MPEHDPYQKPRIIYCSERHKPEIVREIMRFRKQILVDRYGWDLPVCGDLERDEYDVDSAIHGAILDRAQIKACFRLTRTDRPYLAREKFAHLASLKPFPQSPLIWEISRLALAEDAVPSKPCSAPMGRSFISPGRPARRLWSPSPTSPRSVW